MRRLFSFIKNPREATKEIRDDQSASGSLTGYLHIKTQVEFRSSKFPPYDGEEEQINPGLWGKRLAEYLAQHLSEKGFNFAVVPVCSMRIRWQT